MDDLISEFLAETSEGLSVLDLELVRLEKEPNDQEILGNIFRIMHTIKGTCGFLGLPRLASVAHAGENVLGKIRDGKLTATPDIISIVLEAIDCIKGLMTHLETEGKEPDGDDAALIARLNERAEGGEAIPTAEAITPVEAVAETPVSSSAADEFGFEVVLAENTGLEPPAPTEPQVQAEAPKAPPSVDTKPKETKETKANGEAKSGGANQTIRVNIDVLENLMQTVSELVLTRNQLLQLLRTNTSSDFASPLQRLNHITSELQEQVMKSRMQPISSAWSPFPRLVRDLSKDLGKKIELHQLGAETELDRQLLEFIKDPLTHMVRNSCDHGIEMPEERKVQGKQETGNLTLSAYHEGGHIIVEIGDDGKGIATERVKAKVIANGLATEEELAKMSKQQILQFIFKPGFSTAEKVTAVSGRGVGMDVVKTNIEKISGTVELESEEGKGSTFKIKIPLTLAIMPVLIVEASSRRFAIPQANILEMVRTGANSEHVIENINGQPLLRLRGQLLPLIALSKALKLDAEPSTKERHFVVICEIGRFHYGIIVDRVFDTEEIVVKPVSPILQHIDLYSGTTILGDGSVIMILDPYGFARATGELPLKTSASMAAHTDEEEADPLTRFLIFSTGTGSPKVVPLELVTRLEEIDASTIEYTVNGPVIQYRDELMFITQLDADMPLAKEGIIQLIVFIDHDKTLGLVVSEIIDIVEHSVKATAKSSKDGFLGNIVIEEKTCDLVDIGYYFKHIFPDIKETLNLAEHQSLPHLLFVDDSPFFRKFIPPALSAAGYRVTAVEDAQEALKMLYRNTEKFAAIITDMNMPGMNGAEFAKCCKSDKELGRLPVIALTSQSSEQMAAYADSHFLDGYVSKTNHNELIKTIAKILPSAMEAVA